MRRIIGLVVINLILIIFLGLFTPHFLTKANLIVMGDNIALEIIILSGYALLMIAGHFDLSVDGIVALTGVVAGLLMNNGVAWYWAIGVSLIVAATVGFINGFTVAKLGINGFIATLTTWWICVGFSFGMTKATAPYGFPDVFHILGQSRIFGFKSFVLYAIIIALVLSVVLHYRKTGAWIYVSGDNRTAAEMMGIDTTRLGIKLYILMGVLSGFVGLILASRLDAASPIAVDGVALRVIAALVIGGCNLSGGRGTIIGGILGLVMMHILSNAVIQLGMNPYWQKAMLGGVLLAAVLSEKFNLRRFVNVQVK